MTNEELLTQLVAIHFKLNELRAVIQPYVAQDNAQAIRPKERRAEKATIHLHAAANALITATNAAQEWIHCSGGLNQPIASK